MILLFLGILFSDWPRGSGMTYYPLGVGVIQWVLFALLGWNVFGPAVKAG